MHADPHRLIQQTYAIVLAGGRGTRLQQLTDHRAKPAVPFAGSMRIIDFVLGNCVNSGLRRIGVLTQYKAQSLIRHLHRSWGFLEANLGEYVDVIPAQQQTGECWYVGTADAVFQNLALLREAGLPYTLVLGGDHVYKMDYGVMLAEHVARGARVSVACVEVGIEEASSFGVMSVGADGRVLAFDEKPAQPTPVPGRPGRALASMGIYCFDTDWLVAALARDAADPASKHDFGHDLLPAALASVPVYAHDFETSCVRRGGAPYWRDVGTVDMFWEANLDLTRVIPDLDLYDEGWPLPARQPTRPPAKFVFDDFGRRGMAIESLVAGGCIVSGAEVRRSILFDGVRVEDGSVIDESVLLPQVQVGHGVRLRRCVIDKRCVLPDGLRVGYDRADDAARFHVTDRGITLVTPDMLAQR